MRIQALAAGLSVLVVAPVRHGNYDGAFATAHAMKAEVDTCTLQPYTLSFNCSGICDEYSPCIENTPATAGTTTTTTDTSSFCNYKCIQISNDHPTDYRTFQFLIPFASSAVNNAPSGSDEDDTAQYASASNDLLKKIEQLQLPEATTTVKYSTDVSSFVRGRVVDVDLAPNLFQGQSQVTTVLFANINLAAKADTLSTMLPENIGSLLLANTGMYSFPQQFSRFKSLGRLNLASNYISDVNSDAQLGAVYDLSLFSNSIHTFDAVFPNVTALNVRRNMIEEVAEENAVESLAFLNIGVNKIRNFEAFFPNLEIFNVAVTSTQAEFLANLTNFTIDASSLSKDCAITDQLEIHGLQFCILESAVYNADATGAPEASSDGIATNGSGSSSVGTIAGIVSGAFFVGILIIMFAFRARRHKKNKSRKRSISRRTILATPTNNTPAIISLWQDAELLSVQVKQEDIHDLHKIGHGSFGEVWLVKYRNAQFLASKRLRKIKLARQHTQNFIDEIKLVAKLEHSKIVAFIGAAWTIEADLQALFEYMEGGDLRTYLENPHTTQSWTPEKVQIAIDVVEALVYVHSFSPPLVHRDLKSRNVLLSPQLDAKLTDFGSSRFRSENNTMTSGIGTGKWLAPEVICGNNDYGPAADIYSFGAVLSEIDTHMLPYDDVRYSNGGKIADVALLQFISTGQLKPKLSASCPRKIAELAIRCLSFDASDRPNAAQIAYELRTLKKNLFVSL
ncbi:Tkl protein kinase, partial [Globisporangium splendens]